MVKKVTERDRIDLNKQAHEKQAARVTILLNKPVGYVKRASRKKAINPPPNSLPPKTIGKATTAASLSAKNTNLV